MGITTKPNAKQIAVDLAKQFDIDDIEGMVFELTDVAKLERLYRACKPEYSKLQNWDKKAYAKLQTIVGPENEKLLRDYCDNDCEMEIAHLNAYFLMGWATAIRLFTLKPAGRKLVKRGKS